MRKCPKCGLQIDESCVTCPYCGCEIARYDEPSEETGPIDQEIVEETAEKQEIIDEKIKIDPNSEEYQFVKNLFEQNQERYEKRAFWFIISFLIPLIGIFLAFKNRDFHPRVTKKCVLGACLGIVFNVIIMFL